MSGHQLTLPSNSQPRFQNIQQYHQDRREYSQNSNFPNFQENEVHQNRESNQRHVHYDRQPEPDPDPGDDGSFESDEEHDRYGRHRGFYQPPLRGYPNNRDQYVYDSLRVLTDLYQQNQEDTVIHRQDIRYLLSQNRNNQGRSLSDRFLQVAGQQKIQFGGSGDNVGYFLKILSVCERVFQLMIMNYL